MTPEILRTQQFVIDAVSFIVEEARNAIEKRNKFCIALSGGSTPKPVLEALTKVPLDWSRTIITFSDERCVPPTDEQSNYLMACRALLDHISILPQNILRIEGELDPAKAAWKYETTLKERSEGNIYQHDLLLLGIGADGHTASLFPGTHALDIIDRWVIENYVPQLDCWRITFTYPLIAAAKHILFLVNSLGKEKTLEQIFSGNSHYPCSRISSSSGKVTWLVGI